MSLEEEIESADRVVRHFEEMRERHLAFGPRAAAWALGQLRAARAHADMLRTRLAGRLANVVASPGAKVIELFPRAAIGPDARS